MTKRAIVLLPIRHRRDVRYAAKAVLYYFLCEFSMTLLAELDQRQERVLTELDLLNQRAEALLASFLAITRPEGSGEPVANIAGIASPKTESGAAAANSSLRIYNNQNADDSDDEYESDSDSYDSSDDDQD